MMLTLYRRLFSFLRTHVIAHIVDLLVEPSESFVPVSRAAVVFSRRHVASFEYVRLIRGRGESELQSLE